MINSKGNQFNYNHRLKSVGESVNEVVSRVRDFRGTRPPDIRKQVMERVCKLATEENVSEAIAADAMRQAAMKFGTQVPSGQLIILVLWAKEIIRHNGTHTNQVLEEPKVEDKYDQSH